MEMAEAELTVKKLYEEFLGRVPEEKELSRWVKAVTDGRSHAELVSAFVTTQEYRNKFRVKTQFPLGHFYSPIVDPALVKDYVADQRKRKQKEFAGIDISVARMKGFASDAKKFMQEVPFTDNKSDQYRYYYINGNFPYADGIALWGMVCHFRPKQIIEIGSGFSSACILDAAEYAKIENFQLLCVEPNPARLKSTLRAEDAAKVRIREGLVQQVPLEEFSRLNAGDILFIDSTHVLKTGSDVHYELFEILPVLKPGVLVHFHDIQYPFEYPDRWIDDSYSWNEIYALRAFLMYNRKFRVMYWNSYLFATEPEFLRELNPLLVKSGGGSIWLEVT